MGSQVYKKAHVFTLPCSYFFVTWLLVSETEAREMAQQVKTLATTAEDSGFPMSSWGQLTPVSGDLTPSPGSHR